MQARIDLFIRNAQSFKKAFVWQNASLRRLAALMYAAESREADAPAVRACGQLIRQSTGLFSPFRGNSFLFAAAALSLADSPRQQMADTLRVYDLLKKENFKSSDYLAAAACLIAARADPARFEMSVRRAGEWFAGLKREHRLITNQEDQLFAALFGLSSLDVQTGLDRIGDYYLDLKTDFRGRKPVFSLAQVLALAGVPGMPARVRNLDDALRAQDLKLARRFTMAELGVLALLPADAGQIAGEVRAACDYLRMQPGFGSWSIDKQERLLLASALFSFETAGQAGKDLMAATAAAGIVSLVIMQQSAIAMATASAAASAAASAN